MSQKPDDKKTPRTCKTCRGEKKIDGKCCPTCRGTGESSGYSTK